MQGIEKQGKLLYALMVTRRWWDNEPMRISRKEVERRRAIASYGASYFAAQKSEPHF